MDNTRVDKSLPRALYEKIKDFIASSLRMDFDMLVEGYDFFDQVKPSLRYRIVSEVFSEFIERFEYLFISPLDDFRGAKEFQSYFITNLYCRIYVPN